MLLGIHDVVVYTSISPPYYHTSFDGGMLVTDFYYGILPSSQSVCVVVVGLAAAAFVSFRGHSLKIVGVLPYHGTTTTTHMVHTKTMYHPLQLLISIIVPLLVNGEITAEIVSCKG